MICPETPKTEAWRHDYARTILTVDA